jgi:hypothetical protein
MYLFIPPPLHERPAPIFQKLGVYVTAPEAISAAYFINLTLHSVCLNVYPSYICQAKARRHIPVAINTQSTIEKLLKGSFSMQSVS